MECLNAPHMLIAHVETSGSLLKKLSAIPIQYTINDKEGVHSSVMTNQWIAVC